MGNIQWNIEEVEEPKFNAEKMERFMKKDLFAAKLFQGLKRGTKEKRLEIIFTSCVLDDSHMKRSYEGS